MHDDVKVVVYVILALWVTLKCTVFVRRWLTRRRFAIAPGSTVVGFFHPFCAGGGGGERVLWRAIHALARLSKENNRPLHVLVYTGDQGMSPAEILSGVHRQFQIPLDSAELPVSFVYLNGRSLLDPSRYPVLTMLGQSVGSVMLAIEALVRATPDVFMDTTGCAFSFPVAWLAGCAIGAYVHYPTISTVSKEGVYVARPGRCIDECKYEKAQVRDHIEFCRFFSSIEMSACYLQVLIRQLQHHTPQLCLLLANTWNSI